MPEVLNFGARVCRVKYLPEALAVCLPHDVKTWMNQDRIPLFVDLSLSLSISRDKLRAPVISFTNRDTVAVRTAGQTHGQGGAGAGGGVVSPRPHQHHVHADPHGEGGRLGRQRRCVCCVIFVSYDTRT